MRVLIVGWLLGFCPGRGTVRHGHESWPAPFADAPDALRHAAFCLFMLNLRSESSAACRRFDWVVNCAATVRELGDYRQLYLNGRGT